MKRWFRGILKEGFVKVEVKMKVLVINCSPVRNGATAEIVKIVTDCLVKRHNAKNICIDDYDINFAKDVEHVILQQSAFKKMMLIE